MYKFLRLLNTHKSYLSFINNNNKYNKNSYLFENITFLKTNLCKGITGIMKNPIKNSCIHSMLL